jgi:hypothetical protein
MNPFKIKVPHGEKGSDITAHLITSINRFTKTFRAKILAHIPFTMIRAKMTNNRTHEK